MFKRSVKKLSQWYWFCLFMTLKWGIHNKVSHRKLLLITQKSSFLRVEQNLKITLNNLLGQPNRTATAYLKVFCCLKVWWEGLLEHSVQVVKPTLWAQPGMPHLELTSLCVYRTPLTTSRSITSVPNTAGFMGFGYFRHAAWATVSQGWLKHNLWSTDASSSLYRLQAHLENGLPFW